MTIKYTWLIMIGLLSAYSFSSCTTSPFYQNQTAISGAKWGAEFQPEFELEITDTAAQYRAFLLLRHDEAYPFSNIWVRINVQGPVDSVFTQGERIEKTLADSEGKWLARGIGGILEHKIPLQKNEFPELNKKGIYKIRIEQIMRTNPLPSILNIGINIERH
jgi:gliding motility-associated lipoprotein GldH